jgi:preprotein translocase subunit SecG
MMSFVIFIHVIACFILITLVLIQRGRGGGLVESFSGVESMFGTKTTAFLTRITTIFSIVFFMTCLSLAVLSVKQSKSLLSNVKPKAQSAGVKVLPVTEQAKQPVEAANLAQTAMPIAQSAPAQAATQDAPKAK